MSTTLPRKDTLISMPPEILLYIFSFLDLPDLAQLSSISPIFSTVASDPALHRFRILVVAPSRIDHFLCAAAAGGSLRPSIGDLIQRGVMRGLGIERRWRNGLYLYSPQAVRLYWHIQRLDRIHVSHSISSLLVSRSADPAQVLRTTRVVLPDVESNSLHISHVLLPIIHKLKWCLQRDQLAKIYRVKSGTDSIISWVEGNAHLYPENERVRLAICPGVRQLKSFFEERSRPL